MVQISTRPLHLHTLDTLCTDLVAGLAIELGQDGEVFSFEEPAARGILAWYLQNRTKWGGNVYTPDIEAIVDAAGQPPTTAQSVNPTAAPEALRRFTLTHLRAHQFAGLHHAGTEKNKPDDLSLAFTPGVSLFEGFNGSGKTSLLNSVIWALTGEVLRPQRAPEPANKDFTFEVDASAKHTAPPVVPLPDPALGPLTANAIPVDTWVELTFEDQDGKIFQVRRVLTRGPRAVLKEEVVGLRELGLDPIASRVGTTMPGLLPYIQIGSTSALGKAISELTGMAPLVQLASHANRSKKKITTEFTKQKNSEITSVDESYQRAKTDLEQLIIQHRLDIGDLKIPPPSSSIDIEKDLEDIAKRLTQLKSDGLSHAKSILGEHFDAQDEAQRTDLMESIAPAVALIGKVAGLPSMQRLAGLTKMPVAEATAIVEYLSKIREEAQHLTEIAAEPGKAARVRLYARVAAWIKEHPTLKNDDDSCAVCGGNLIDVVDPATGLKVKEHLSGAASEGDYAGRTIHEWSKHAIGQLMVLLTPSITAEVKGNGTPHPAELLQKAIAVELFTDKAFSSSLKPLQEYIHNECKRAIDNFPEFQIKDSTRIGKEQKELDELNRVVQRVEQALQFSAWRQTVISEISAFMTEVVGRPPVDGGKTEQGSLLGRLKKLQAMVEAIEPVNNALNKQKLLMTDIAKRRNFEKRLAAYDVAAKALDKCIEIGELSGRQIEQLQNRLHSSAALWRTRIYRSAFPSTSMELVSSKMSGDGDLQLMVGVNRLAAPAQHVSNASALRASLLAFFLAYWEYMLRERGGLCLLLLDDPQELLDGDNRERLADAVHDIVNAKAQLILTTHDKRFAAAVARRVQAKSLQLSHQYVHPATVRRGTIFLTPSVLDVQEARDKFDANPDNAQLAQSYLSECRIFLEGRMGDFFDDTAYPAATAFNLAPTLSDHLGRLKGLVNDPPSELFRSLPIIRLARDVALNPGSPTLALLNKAHHSDKSLILPADVVAVREDLERLRKAIERAHEEFRTFRRREPLALAPSPPSALKPAEVPNFRIPIQANLRAFVRDASYGDSQETELEELDSKWFQAKAFFYLRSNTLGFAGPQGSVAIVDVEAVSATDRQLVIARTGNEVFARRLLRPKTSDHIALAAETPDPRKSPPTELLPEQQVALHPIVGILFSVPMPTPPSKKETVQITYVPHIQKIQSAYRIKEESAVPLALPGQVALGGNAIPLESFDSHIDEYVALHLDDGSSIFKRVGNRLPAPLQHLRQFETIGGMGVADVLAVENPHNGFRTVVHAVSVIGVLYN
ncbi:AAA family ATPase [Delftia sp. GW456-R20]|uniref:AAA family ATPase n=1 Tax=Delftia sp. GW456-R20 TaxID=1827145 RepID=UPI0009ED45C2|nr:AAA family ATPase [Delftia sp. GW456-R20]